MRRVIAQKAPLAYLPSDTQHCLPIASTIYIERMYQCRTRPSFPGMLRPLSFVQSPPPPIALILLPHLPRGLHFAKPFFSAHPLNLLVRF